MTVLVLGVVVALVAAFADDAIELLRDGGRFRTDP